MFICVVINDEDDKMFHEHDDLEKLERRVRLLIFHTHWENVKQEANGP